VILNSPTTTERDHAAVEYLGRVLALEPIGFGREMFTTTSDVSQVGADVIGMTQFPEVTLARELELCYATVALVTDYDVGVDDIQPVTHEEVLRVFGENIDRVRDLLADAIPAVPAERTCPCATALAGTGHA
jgi:hypothetical protein